jgi:hypothetical protein
MTSSTLVITDAYIPNKAQATMHACPAKHVLFGGAWGGGKTYALCKEVIQLMLEYPGIEGIIARYLYKDVMEPTQIYDQFHKAIPEGVEYQAHRSPPAWTRFKNGSRCTFVGLEDYKAGAQYGFIGIDQAEQVPVPNALGENILQQLSMRLRQELPHPLPNGSVKPHYRMILTCNPAPGWLEERFIPELEVPDRDGIIWGDPVNRDYAFIGALPEDNIDHLPEGYLEEARRTLSSEDFERYIRGSWKTFVGQAMTEYTQQVHVIEPFDAWLDEGWPVYRGIDYGLSSPNVAEFVTVAPNGDIYFVDELVREGEIPSTNAKEINSYSQEMRIVQTWFDPRMGQTKVDLTTSKDWSVFDEYKKYGVHGRLSRATREQRIGAWKTGLKIRDDRVHPRNRTWGAPMVYITTNCQRLIWELPRLKYSMSRPDDIEKENDHAFDAGGFVLAQLIARRGPASGAMPGRTVAVHAGGRQQSPYVGVVR